jgi:hypothetical protein
VRFSLCLILRAWCRFFALLPTSHSRRGALSAVISLSRPPHRAIAKRSQQENARQMRLTLLQAPAWAVRAGVENLESNRENSCIGKQRLIAFFFGCQLRTLDWKQLPQWINRLQQNSRNYLFFHNETKNNSLWMCVNVFFRFFSCQDWLGQSLWPDPFRGNTEYERPIMVLIVTNPSFYTFAISGIEIINCLTAKFKILCKWKNAFTKCVFLRAFCTKRHIFSEISCIPWTFWCYIVLCNI